MPDLKDQYDIFIVHSGSEKREFVDCMKTFLEAKGFRCFVDSHEIDHQSSPVKQMQICLETSRHVLVVLSSEFLQRRAPQSELKYAYNRHKWLQKQPFRWFSIWVVLYDLTIDDYKQACESDPSLPHLGKNVTCFEYNERYKRCVELSKHVSSDIAQQDKDKGQANRKWSKFLKKSQVDTTFPRADVVYSDPGDGV